MSLTFPFLWIVSFFSDFKVFQTKGKEDAPSLDSLFPSCFPALDFCVCPEFSLRVLWKDNGRKREDVKTWCKNVFWSLKIQLLQKKQQKVLVAFGGEDAPTNRKTLYSKEGMKMGLLSIQHAKLYQKESFRLNFHNLPEVGYISAQIIRWKRDAVGSWWGEFRLHFFHPHRNNINTLIPIGPVHCSIPPSAEDNTLGSA